MHAYVDPMFDDQTHPKVSQLYVSPMLGWPTAVVACLPWPNFGWPEAWPAAVVTFLCWLDR